MSETPKVIEIQHNSTPTPTPQPVVVPEPVQHEAVVKEPVVEEKQDRVSAKFRELSKKERAVQQQQAQMKEQAAKVAAFEASLAEVKTNPLKLLEQAGLSLEDLLISVLDEGKEPEPEDRLTKAEKRLEAYDKMLEDHAKEQEAQAQAALEAETAQNRGKLVDYVTNFVEENSEQFELVKAYSAISDVMAVMEHVWTESNGETTMSLQEAVQLVEDQLLEEKQLEAQRLIKSKKLAQVFSPLTTPTSSQASKPTQASNQVSTTLTNKVAAVEAQQPPTGLSREERIERAAAKLVWK